MARTKQTARKSSGGKAPRKMMACKSKASFRNFMVSRQQVTYGGGGLASGKGKKKKSAEKQTSYLNYENMFYSYDFNTGPPTTGRFEPRFTTGAGVNPVTKETEHWVGMSLNSKFDGEGMKKHGRPHLNLVVVLDVSGSMSSSFSDDYTAGSKLDVAKHCLQSLCDQLKPNDSFGLVKFNDLAEVHCDMQPWKKVGKKKLKDSISTLQAYGCTSLSTAIDCATDMFRKAKEAKDATSRIIFLTDLQSTVDSVNDEKKLLSTIKTNADRGIYTTVVGIGMDLNVALVEDISGTKGAKYCSVDSKEEFSRIMNKEFDYDVTILAFNISVEIKSPGYRFVKGYGSPELSGVASGKPVLISSEFPSWKNDRGETKGGMLLFKLGTGNKGKAKKGKKPPTSSEICPGNTFEVEVKFDTLEGVRETHKHTLTVVSKFTDTGTRKGALLVHYVDLQNDYVLNRATKGTTFVELFQSFRTHFLSELEDMKDKSIATTNKGDLELIDKIIALEMDPSSKGTDDDDNDDDPPFGHPKMPGFRQRFRPPARVSGPPFPSLFTFPTTSVFSTPPATKRSQRKRPASAAVSTKGTSGPPASSVSTRSLRKRPASAAVSTAATSGPPVKKELLPGKMATTGRVTRSGATAKKAAPKTTRARTSTTPKKPRVVVDKLKTPPTRRPTRRVPTSKKAPQAAKPKSKSKLVRKKAQKHVSKKK